jgi:signal transduction histidine kinase
MLAVIAVSISAVLTQYIMVKNYNLESLAVKEYRQSSTFYNEEVQGAFNEAEAVLAQGSPPKGLPYYYYISDGKRTFTNAVTADRSFFEQYDKAFYSFEKGSWTFGANTYDGSWRYGIIDNLTAYIAFPDEYLSQQQKAWESSRAALIPLAAGLAGCIVLALMMVAFSAAASGRLPGDEELHPGALDMVYTDVLLCGFIPLGLAWLSGLGFGFGTGLPLNVSMLWTGVLTALETAACGIIFLSLVRRVKGKKLLRQSLVYTSSDKAFDFFKSLFDGRKFQKYPLTKSLFYRQLVFIAASLILVAMTLAFWPAFVLEAAVIYWYVQGNNRTFEEIDRGFNESLQEQMKAERMKIDLVTNVSHDLKTPLTSIISYVDLLSKEDSLSETARDYVKILAEKSNRLKHIVSDLFDLAKSTSGDISLELESLDIKRLIEQTLGDMQDEIEASGLQVVSKLPDHPVVIMSDGKKLYRVFQNVLDNALKYSLKGTRVFVELAEDGDKVTASVKNIAGYEMNFTEDEILQRFSRGDKSRATDGSGLGLSIAESFTSVCGGKFKVDIDGDMFKVAISF